MGVGVAVILPCQQRIVRACGMHFHRFVGLFQIHWLCQQQPGNRKKSNQQNDALYGPLIGEHWFVHGTRLQSDVDEGGDKIGRLASLTSATVLQRTSGDQGGSGIAFRAHGTATTKKCTKGKVNGVLC